MASQLLFNVRTVGCGAGLGQCLLHARRRCCRCGCVVSDLVCAIARAHQLSEDERTVGAVQRQTSVCHLHVDAAAVASASPLTPLGERVSFS